MRAIHSDVDRIVLVEPLFFHPLAQTSVMPQVAFSASQQDLQLFGG